VVGGYEKTGILRFEKNEKTLERIRRAGLQIACLVVHDDGCRHSGEGGQNTCILENPFFERVLEIVAPEGLKLILNHCPPMIRELRNMITWGKVGNCDEIMVSGTWYTITLVRTQVMGLHDAREVLIQRKEVQEPMEIFIEEEIQTAFFRTMGVDANEIVR
jgi:hypothetical protein